MRYSKCGCEFVRIGENNIDQLAKEYAQQECTMSKHKGKKLKQLHEDKLLEFYDVFGFLYEKNLIKGLEYQDLDSINLADIFEEDD